MQNNFETDTRSWSNSENASNVIHKRLAHTSVSRTFFLHRDLLIIIRNHNNTTQWTLNLKKSEFFLLFRLFVQIKKCRFDVLQKRTTFLKSFFVIEWKTVSRRSKNVMLNIIWSRSKKKRSYDIFLIWIRENSYFKSTTYEIWLIFFAKHVTSSLLTSDDHTISYNVVLSSRRVFRVRTIFKELFVKISIK